MVGLEVVQIVARGEVFAGARQDHGRQGGVFSGLAQLRRQRVIRGEVQCIAPLRAIDRQRQDGAIAFGQYAVGQGGHASTLPASLDCAWAYSWRNVAMMSAAGRTLSMPPTPCPAPQMSCQGLTRVEPKFDAPASGAGRLAGSSPAAAKIGRAHV